jgi:hypothetical protein
MSSSIWLDVLRDLAKLGIRLSVTRLADGTLRLNCWRTVDYWGNRDAAEKHWSALMAQDPGRVEELKQFLLCPSNRRALEGS